MKRTRLMSTGEFRFAEPVRWACGRPHGTGWVSGAERSGVVMTRLVAENYFKLLNATKRENGEVMDVNGGCGKMYKIVLRVKEVRGECAAKLRPGDKITYLEPQIVMEETDRICVFALSAILPYLSALSRETAEREDWIPLVRELQCPDPVNRVVFEVERHKVE